MHVPPIVSQYLERPDIQEKLLRATTPESKIAVAREVHSLLPFAMGVVIKEDYIADVLDEHTLARYSAG